LLLATEDINIFGFLSTCSFLPKSKTHWSCTSKQKIYWRSYSVL